MGQDVRRGVSAPSVLALSVTCLPRSPSSPSPWLTKKGGPEKRGWCSRSGAIDLWGCNRSGACRILWCADVLRGFRVQNIICNTMQ
eukprot:9492125-Pyramimonas_sp.AAC.1